jgi:hypothetical protein
MSSHKTPVGHYSINPKGQFLYPKTLPILCEGNTLACPVQGFSIDSKYSLWDSVCHSIRRDVHRVTPAVAALHLYGCACTSRACNLQWTPLNQGGRTIKDLVQFCHLNMDLNLLNMAPHVHASQNCIQVLIGYCQSRVLVRI